MTNMQVQPDLPGLSHGQLLSVNADLRRACQEAFQQAVQVAHEHTLTLCELIARRIQEVRPLADRLYLDVAVSRHCDDDGELFPDCDGHEELFCLVSINTAAGAALPPLPDTDPVYFYLEQLSDVWEVQPSVFVVADRTIAPVSGYGESILD